MPPVSHSESREVWIGLASVHQRPGAGVLVDENDAFVQTLALAASYDEFCAAIQQAVDALGFDLVEIEDVEPLAVRRQHCTVDNSLLAKAIEVQESGFPRFGDFHTWQSDS